MISSLGFTTKDRPHDFKRCIESFIRHCRKFERFPRLVVVDDATPDSSSASEELTRSLQRRNPDFAFTYIGWREKRELVQYLVNDGFTPDVLHYALLDPESMHYTLGANRNALVLATVGEKVLFVDDDCVLELSRPPEWDDRLLVSGRRSSLEYWFFKDRRSALRATQTAEEQDFLSLHEAYLGRSSYEVINEHRLKDSLIELTPTKDCLRILNGDTRIKITLSGMVGDCCMYSNLGHLLGRSERTLQRLVESEEAIHTAMTSRELIRSPNQPCLRLGGILIGPVYGSDHTGVVPPYMPLFRSSDTSYSCILALIEPHTASIDIPWLVTHLGTSGRMYDERGYTKSWVCSFGEVFRVLLHTASLSSSHSFVDPLSTRGASLQTLGKLPLPEFIKLVSGLIDEMIEMKIAGLEHTHERAGGISHAFDQVLSQSIRCLKESLSHPLRYVPADIYRRGYSIEDTLRITQRLVKLYGHLLQEWLAIFRAVTQYSR